jgi:hypothetical protein
VHLESSRTLHNGTDEANDIMTLIIAIIIIIITIIHIIIIIAQQARQIINKTKKINAK